jgi:hypothetical protein
MRKIKISLIFTGLLSVLLSKSISAQCFSQPDKNPHDIVYCRMTEQELPQIKVVYGRPDAKDEIVFGTQVPFGKIWRTGTNEATEIRFYQDVMFGNKFVEAGTYVLYTIPNKNTWTIILNKKTDSYGAFFYDPEENIVNLEIQITRGRMLENFSIGFKKEAIGSSQMVLAWATTRVQIPISQKKS